MSKKKKTLNTVKTLDVQWGTPKMPDDVKKYFFDIYENIGNDCWVEYIVCDDPTDVNILDKWLLKNTDVCEGETILLKHWW